jgi:hypothetical protein
MSLAITSKAIQHWRASLAANVVLEYDKGDYLAKVRMLQEIGTSLRFQFLNK